jgi:hypothetical protein
VEINLKRYYSLGLIAQKRWWVSECLVDSESVCRLKTSEEKLNKEGKLMDNEKLNRVRRWAILAFFEYRIDGQVLTSGTSHPVVIGDFIYPGICVDGRTGPGQPVCGDGTPEIMTFTAAEYVEVRLALGGERDWDFDWTRFDVLLPTYSCVGFDPPLDTDAINVKNNKKVLPFKATLLDGDGNPVTDISPPMLECVVSGNGGSILGEPVAVDLLPAGKGSDGNLFEPTGDGWQYNVKLWNFGASTYTCYMIPGNGYNIDPECTVDVEIQD